MFGFLGPNGAGKSTTIDILLNHISPTSGSVEILGRNVRRDPVVVKNQVGVLPDRYAVFERMSGRRHVQFAIRAKGSDDDPDALLERVNLDEAADRPATSYSKGMKQRLMLAMGLAGSPALLVLSVFLFRLWEVVPTVVELVRNGMVAPETTPEWGLVFEQLNPVVAYNSVVIKLYPELAATHFLGDVIEAPAPYYLQPSFSLAVLIGWVIVPLAVAYLRFRATDI